jgi:hypothetical protein
MPKGAVDLAEKLSLFSDHWSPKVVARLNDYEVKVVKLHGEFVWHKHDETDELFLVIGGELLGLGGRITPTPNVAISNIPGPRKTLYYNGASLQRFGAITVL